MIRFILYLLVAYFVLTIIRVATRTRRYRREAAAERRAEEQGRAPEFLNIKDAEFEDLPPGEGPDPSAKP